ncbi:MAG: DEAD/DEAH box helicase, partial [Planctomycetes bacterium]|nr:DEAD/DEAH box helicase [Planctomycetota bacterium]
MPFTTLGLPAVLCETLRRQGFETPTPIQERSIPFVLGGADIVASAETGSGKTAAFLLPVLARLLQGRRPAGSRALVLVPTRELALQVRGVAIDLSEGTSIGCAAVYGGVGMEEQSRALRGGVDIVVATPGRLLDHAGRGATRFGGLEVLVLDEADRMLDMGFLPDVRRILALLPAARQTLLFSATMPPEVDRLAREVMRSPERVRVGNPRKAAAPVGITHAVFPVPAHRKTALITVLLRRERMDAVLVFTRTKHRADRLAKALRPHGIEAGVLHGDRTQGQRERTMAAFREGKVKVLVATDLAARGIDVEGITHVVNFDFPRTSEDYLHRVGRTARALAKGDAFTLVAPEEMAQIAKLEREIGTALPRVTLPDFDYAASPPPHQGGGGGGGGGSGGGRARRPGGSGAA